MTIERWGDPHYGGGTRPVGGTFFVDRRVSLRFLEEGRGTADEEVQRTGSVCH